MVHIRGAGYALTRAIIEDTDGVGHVLTATSFGRIRGEAGETPDERITTHKSFENVAGSVTGWLWRPRSSYLDGAGDSIRLADYSTDYSPEGDAIRTTTVVIQTRIPRFDGDGEAEGFGSRAPENVVASVVTDAWGSPGTTCVGGDASTQTRCLRLGRIRYDQDFAITPLTQSTYTRPLPDGSVASLDTQASWDRGLMQPTEVVDANSQPTRVFRDAFGRTTAIRAPNARGCSGNFLSTRMEYLESNDSVLSPLSRVRVTTFLSCVGFDKTIEVFDYSMRSMDHVVTPTRRGCIAVVHGTREPRDLGEAGGPLARQRIERARVRRRGRHQGRDVGVVGVAASAG
jgi:YD repeat-containing protein